MELRNIKEDENIIEKVIPGSIAEELEIEPGDILISINGMEIKDIIDYRFCMTDEYIEVEIKKPDGEIWELEIEKDYDEDLGIEFTNPLIDCAKSCRNKCIFCFIDQLPKGMRETLYFKDDDSRLSFLQGNFVTLTNMSEDEIERIIRYRISPINISVHSTDPEVRVKMLTNKNAGKLYDIMKRFKEAGIAMNCQIVLVRGVNDKENLTRTVSDLSALYPEVNSVAVVPIGLTKFRENLYEATPYEQNSSIEVLNQIEEMQKKYMSKISTRFIFASDEFYVMADKKLPEYDEYEGFPQIDNGIGLIKQFEKEVKDELNQYEEVKNQKRYLIATGTSAFEFMSEMAQEIEKNIKEIKVDVKSIKNKFFGETITVAGLVTGGDIIKQLSDIKNYDVLIIPKSMLRSGDTVFLDDVTVEDVEKALNIKVIATEVEGKEFVEVFTKRRSDI